MSETADVSAPSDSAESRSMERSDSLGGLVALLLAAWLALSVARLLHAEPLQSANDRSRWATVWSLVEEGTYRIDKIRQRPGWDTIDLVRHDGHFYSTKPPVFPTLVAGLYWLEKQALGWTLDDDVSATTRLLLLVVNVLPMFVALLLLSRVVRRACDTRFAWALVITTACFGTLLNPFLPVLNNHTPGAVCVIFTLCAVIPIVTAGDRRGSMFGIAGFWAAAACCFELPAAAFGVITFLLLMRADARRTVLWFVPAALIPLTAFFYTNFLVTGGWKPFYAYYGTEKYEFIHNGIPSYWMNPRGIDRAQDSFLTYFLHCTVGHHGLLSLSPVLLLTVGGWCTGRTWRTPPWRLIHGTGLGLTAVVFAFFMTKTDNYNYGGVSVGLRWMLWLVPFWLLAMIPFLDAWRPGRWGRGVCAVLLTLSVFSAWYPFDSPWQQPWLFRVMTDAGWIDYSDPPPPQAEPYHSWIRSVPGTAGEEPNPVYWIEFEGVDNQGRLTRLRLSDGGGLSVQGRRARKLVVTRSTEGQQQSMQELVLDIQALASGAPVEQILLWPDAGPTAAERARAVEFLRGLPAPRPYAPGKLRYLGSPLRREAFQTRHAASRVLATRRDHPRPTIYRRDVWTTDDVPYGVLEYRVSIQDARTGEVVRQTTMRARAAGEVAEFDPGRLILE